MRRLLGRAALAGAVTLLALGPATVSRADEPAPTPTATAQPGRPRRAPTRPSCDKVLAEVRAELAESSEQMVLAAADLRLTDQALPGARATVKRTQQLLAEAQRRQEQTALRRGRAQVRYTLSTEAAEETAARVAEQQDRIGRLARAVYQGGGSLGNVSMLLDAQSPSDFAERLVSLQTVVSSQRSVLDDLATVQASFGQQTDDLERVRDDFAAADEQAQADLQRVTDLADQARAAVTRVNSLVATRKAALAAAAAGPGRRRRRARPPGRGVDPAAGSARGRGPRRAGPGRQPRRRVRARPGRHAAWPVRGPITSPFGMRVHPVTGVYKLHTGTDLGVPCGTAVHVALPGVVVQAGWNSAYGWRTVVSHGVVGGVLLTTTYNHQTHIDVSVGDQVAAGVVIGTSGTTGYSTGCHLHFELYVNSALVDPEPWLPAH